MNRFYFMQAGRFCLDVSAHVTINDQHHNELFASDEHTKSNRNFRFLLTGDQGNPKAYLDGFEAAARAGHCTSGYQGKGVKQ